jgi:hypothetical protein
MPFVGSFVERIVTTLASVPVALNGERDLVVVISCASQGCLCTLYWCLVRTDSLLLTTRQVLGAGVLVGVRQC